VVQTAWFLAWTPYALFHGLNVFMTTWINYPLGADLAQNTPIPLLGLITSPLTLAVSPVASENLLRFLAFPLSAFAMYFVLRAWVAYEPAAFVGGLVYGFSPYVVGQASVHLDLSFVPLPPLIMYVVYEIVVRQDKSRVKWGLGLGALMAAQFYISAEILATTVTIIAIAVCLLAIFRFRFVASHLWHAFGGLLIGGVLALVCCAYPLYLMTHGPLHYIGPSVALNNTYNADLLGQFLPTTAQLVSPLKLVANSSASLGGMSNVEENGSYLGIPLVLILIGLVVRHVRRRWVLFAALMAVISSVLALGPRLMIDGKYYHLPFHLPFQVFSHISLVNDMLPVRLSLYVALFASVVLALGIAASHQDATRAREHQDAVGSTPLGVSRFKALATRTGVVVLSVMAVVALLPQWPYRSSPLGVPVAELPASLNIIPQSSAVLTYPYVAPATNEAMLWQALDKMRFKLFGSYVLRRGPGGAATQLPSGLKPYDVEGMLVDALASRVVLIPGVAYTGPTFETVVASKVVICRRDARHCGAGSPQLSGVVENASVGARSFYVVRRNNDLVVVRVRKATRYFGANGSRSSLGSIARGERVAVYGRTRPGTIGTQRVKRLRVFLSIHHVDAVVVELGLPGSNEVVTWMRETIGAPTHLGDGGAIWVHVQRDLARQGR